MSSAPTQLCRYTRQLPTAGITPQLREHGTRTVENGTSRDQDDGGDRVTSAKNIGGFFGGFVGVLSRTSSGEPCADIVNL